MHCMKLILCFLVLVVGVNGDEGEWVWKDDKWVWKDEATPTPGQKKDQGSDDTPEDESQDDQTEENNVEDKKNDKEEAPTLPKSILGTDLGNAEFNDPNYTPLPNMVAGVRGYNILEGNPFKDSGDPGFVTQLFIPATLKNGRIELETGITANDLSTCKRSMEATSIASLESLTNFTEDMTKSGYELQIGVETEVTRELSISGDVKAVEAEAGISMTNTIPPPFERAWGKSRELQEMSNIFSKEEKMLSISFGFCEQYEMIIDRAMTPPFTDMLKNGIALLNSATNLNDTMKNEAFKLFIQDFGTHFMQEVRMGAQFMAITEYTKLARDKLTAKALNDCSYQKGSKIFGIQVEENSDSCTQEDNDELKQIGNENSKLSILTKGSRPTDIEDWATQDFDPVPVKFKLAPIVNLFRPRYFEKWNVQDKDGNAIKAEDIMAWFLPMYWSEVQFCKTMNINCEKKVGCGLNDKCPVDTLCDRTAPLDKQQTCTHWTEWQCSAKCGRGHAEARTRQCDGCIGTTHEEVQRVCKGKRGCYTSMLKIKALDVDQIKATVAEIPKDFDQHFSVCLLFKVASRSNSVETALFNLNSESGSVLKLLLAKSPGGLKVVLGDTDFVFADFKDVLKWEHICLVWKHQWSVYGEATLYVNGLFLETKTVGLSKTPMETKTDGSPKKPLETANVKTSDSSEKALGTPSKSITVASPGDVIIGGHKEKSGTIVNNFMGTMSGLYIYDRILTAADVDDAYRGYAPTGGEIFVWDDIMRPSVSIPDDASTISKTINPPDVVSAREEHYYFDIEPAPHAVAETKCEILGGELTSINAPAQNEQLVEELKKRNLEAFWVGLTKTAGSSTWTWSNGEALGQGHWNSWEEGALPTNLPGKACAIVDSNGKWKPETCANRFAFACIINEEKIGLKSARQSSKDGEQSADLAYDGDFTTYAKTHGAANGWWKAELNRQAVVTMVHVYALKEDGTSYTGFKATTSMDGKNWNLCDQSGSKKLKDLFVLTCNPAERGKFIKIESKDGPLKLFEAQVYGKLPKDMVHFPKPTTGTEKGRPYTQGYIEIRHNGKWGTICDHVFKDNNYGATAVCKMMGFVDGAYAEDYKQEELATKRNLPVWLDGVSCASGAQSIVGCLQRPWGDHNCREGPKPHQHDVGVRCYRSQEMQIRLTNTFQGSNNDSQRYIQGPIQFQKNGNWHYMCGTLGKKYDYTHKDPRSETQNLPDVTSAAADVFCRILGHKRGELKDPVQVNTDIKQQKIATVHCDAGAESLSDCTIYYDNLWRKKQRIGPIGRTGMMMEKPYDYHHCTTPPDQTSIRCYV